MDVRRPGMPLARVPGPPAGTEVEEAVCRDVVLRVLRVDGARRRLAVPVFVVLGALVVLAAADARVVRWPYPEDRTLRGDDVDDGDAVRDPASLAAAVAATAVVRVLRRVVVRVLVRVVVAVRLVRLPGPALALEDDFVEEVVVARGGGGASRARRT